MANNPSYHYHFEPHDHARRSHVSNATVSACCAA